MTLAHCAVEREWPALLDVVRIDLAEARPEPWQPENWTLNDRVWQRIDRLDPADAARTLRGIVNPGVRMLQTTDRTVDADALRSNPIDASLTLVAPDTLRWRIETHPSTGNRQQKAFFSIDGIGTYDLQVTDPPVETQLEGLALGFHDREAVEIGGAADVFLTISLADADCRMRV